MRRQSHGGSSILDKNFISLNPQIKSFSFYDRLSFRNEEQQLSKHDNLINRLIMMITTISFIFYIFISSFIGFSCGNWTESKKQQIEKKRKKLMPILLGIGVIYTLVFLSCIIIVVINRRKDDDWMGILGIGIWCQISIILLFSKKQNKSMRCYHIIIMYITFILYPMLFYTFFLKK